MRGPAKKLTLPERMAIRRAMHGVERGTRRLLYADLARKHSVSVTTIGRTVNG